MRNWEYEKSENFDLPDANVELSYRRINLIFS